MADTMHCLYFECLIFFLSFFSSTAIFFFFILYSLLVFTLYPLALADGKLRKAMHNYTIGALRKALLAAASGGDQEGSRRVAGAQVKDL